MRNERCVEQHVGSVTMGIVQGVTNASVKFRKTPSVTGKALTYTTNPFDPAFPAVPDKTLGTIIAHTKDKVQIWKNYWYLVNVRMSNPEVWMFGEFVKMK